MNNILMILLVISACACQGGEGGPGRGKEAAPEGKTGTSIQALDTGKDPKRLNPVGPFMTSPAWLPDGSGIIAFGWKGMGLYAADTVSGRIEILGPALRSPLIWSKDRTCFCVREGIGPSLQGWARFDYDGVSGKIMPVAEGIEACRAAQGPGETERTLYDQGGLKVIQDERTSSLKILHEGKETLVEDHGAWGAAVSPVGSRIAYATGPLKDCTLHIYDPVEGKTTIGRGSYPSWFPDGTSIVYAVPETDIDLMGAVRVVRSELYRYDLGSSAPVRLTDTGGIIEMQPSVSPSGDRVAFCDWKGGGLFVMPAGKEAGS